MKLLRGIIKSIDTLNNFIGKVGAWSVILLTFLVVYEVISRRFLGAPTIWTYETITMIYGFHFMIVAAYALVHKSMVSVDILYEKLTLKKQAILDIVTYCILFFPFVISIFYISIGYAHYSWSTKEVSTSLFAPPLYPIKTIIPIAFGLLMLQGISEVLKRVYILIKGERYES